MHASTLSLRDRSLSGNLDDSETAVAPLGAFLIGHVNFIDLGLLRSSWVCQICYILRFVKRQMLNSQAKVRHALKLHLEPQQLPLLLREQRGKQGREMLFHQTFLKQGKRCTAGEVRLL